MKHNVGVDNCKQFSPISTDGEGAGRIAPLPPPENYSPTFTNFRPARLYLAQGHGERRVVSCGCQTMPTSPRESDEMNTQRKFLAGGAAAVVALGVAAVLMAYPSRPNDTVGTVVPAERYRAPQTGAEAVGLAESGAVAPIGGDARAPAEANVEAAVLADRTARTSDAERVSRLTDAERSSKPSDAERVSKLNDAERVSKLNDAERTSRLIDADRAAKRNASERTSRLVDADRTARAIDADKSGARK